MNLPDTVAHGAVRFSLSRMTTEPEIEETIAKVPPLIARLRQTLPV
jgi:cysteine desulfurase